MVKTTTKPVTSTDEAFARLVETSTLKIGGYELIYVDEAAGLPYMGGMFELELAGLWVELPSFQYVADSPTVILPQHVHIAEPAGARAAFDAIVLAICGADALPVRALSRTEPGMAVTIVDTPSSSTAHLAGQRGEIVAIDPRPEYEGGEFWRVRVFSGEEVDWHHECFAREPWWIDLTTRLTIGGKRVVIDDKFERFTRFAGFRRSAGGESPQLLAGDQSSTEPTHERPPPTG